MKTLYSVCRSGCSIAVMLLLLKMHVMAQGVVSENWESYAPGATVASPWIVGGGGGTTPATSTVTVVNTAINSVTSNWVLINNAATNEPSANPGLKITGTAISSEMNLTLQYSIPQNYGSGSQIYLNLSSGTTTGVTLILGRNWQRSGIGYINAAGQNVGVGHTFSAGETIMLNLTRINVAKGTYDIAWSSSSGAYGSVTGATFAHSVASIDTLTVGECSPAAGTSQIYLDNIALKVNAGLKENWESYAPGSTVASPWVVTGGGGSTPAASSVTVINTTINSVTSNWALINNAATNEPSANPELKSTFPALSSTASLSLTYSIPENYGSGSQVYLTLYSGTTSGIRLVLGCNWARYGIGYFGSSGTNVGVGHTFTPGETVTLKLLNINFTTHAYDIYWSSNTGAFGSVTGATFTHSVTSIDTLVVGECSPVAGTSKIYLDDIEIKAITDSVSVDFPDAFNGQYSSRFPVFNSNQDVTMVFTVTQVATTENCVNWQILDYKGSIVRQGTVATSGSIGTVATYPVTVGDMPSGYMELRASLMVGGSSLPARGSRFSGMASFGVLPALQALTVPAYNSRFGCQGSNFIVSGTLGSGDFLFPVYTTLGARRGYISRDWLYLEPNNPLLSGEKSLAEKLSSGRNSTDCFVTNDLSHFNTLVKKPAWSYTVQGITDAWSPQAWGLKDSTCAARYTSFGSALAAELALRETNRYGVASPTYYQFDWEPDFHWLDTDQQFIDQFKAVRDGLHAGDPNAIVLGPTYAIVAQAVAEYGTLFPLGLNAAIDGISIHGYYTSQSDYSGGNTDQIPPEYGAVAAGEGVYSDVARIACLKNTYLGANAKMFMTEWGMDYGLPYSKVSLTQNYDRLQKQAAYETRGHIMFLGEKCDATFFFYTADYGDATGWSAGTGGYGLCFNLVMSNPTASGSGTISFGSPTVSPKPVYMALCTLTRILEGTTTTGRLTRLGAPAVVFGYAFKRDSTNVIALWTKDNTNQTVSIPSASALTMYDIMGNAATVAPSSGAVSLTVGQYPIYVFGVTDAVLSNLQ